MPKKEVFQKKEQLKLRLDNYFQDTYLDVQAMSPNLKLLDEAYLAKILTKLAVSSATVWWSFLEIKEFINLRKKSKGIFK